MPMHITTKTAPINIKNNHSNENPHHSNQYSLDLSNFQKKGKIQNLTVSTYKIDLIKILFIFLLFL